jgi:hypothetical protein
MAQDSMAGGRPFEIGTTLSTTFSVLGRNIVTFLAISVLIGIPYILIVVLGVGMGASGGDMSAAMGAMAMIGALVALLTYVVAQAAINYGAFQDLRGNRPQIGDCLRQGFAAMPRVVGAGLIAILAIGGIAIVTMFLAFIPIVGLIIMVAVFVLVFFLLVNWWVIIPVIAVEKTGVLECFSRSRALTAGNRWRILGLLIVVGLAQGVINFIVEKILGGGGAMLVVGLILTVAVTLVFITFNAVLTAVGYYYLRSGKEGIVIDDIVKVFD